MQRGEQLGCAGRALLRTGGTLLIIGAAQGRAISTETGQQPALIADAQRGIGKLMNQHRAAYEVHARRRGGQLQNQVLEGHGVIIAHHALAFG